MRKGFLGVTAHWISVESGRWTLESAVIGFQSILGGHDGENLGRYVVGITDRRQKLLKGKCFARTVQSHDADKIFQYSCTSLPLTMPQTMAPPARRLRRFMNGAHSLHGLRMRTRCRE